MFFDDLMPAAAGIIPAAAGIFPAAAGIIPAAAGIISAAAGIIPTAAGIIRTKRRLPTDPGNKYPHRLRGGRLAGAARRPTPLQISRAPKNSICQCLWARRAQQNNMFQRFWGRRANKNSFLCTVGTKGSPNIYFFKAFGPKGPKKQHSTTLLG